jgi:putative pyrroloquinoline-quinone-binding quinoprotein/putative pyrroloquinoline-quinone binding quinoprotein
MRGCRISAKLFTTSSALAVGMSLLLATSVATAPQSANPAPAAAPALNEWLTWGYDQERTLWNRAETTLNKDNVGQLALKWKTQIPTPPREVVLATLTTPLVATVNSPQGPVMRVFVVGSDNTTYAVDATTGAIVWQRAFPNDVTPPVAPDYRCPSTQNATPVIDKESGIIYVSTSDGKLRGLSVVNGEDRMPAIEFTNGFARNWSLNLIDGIIYSPTARGCLGIPSHLTSVDLKDPLKQKREFFTSPGGTSGAWGRGGIVRGPKYIYLQTADGPYDPGAGKFGNSVLAVSFKELRLVDSYTPENWEYLNAKDLDLSSANAVAFPFEGKTIVASVGKESVVSLLDGDNLGGGNHQSALYTSPRWGNDEALLHDRGVWGAMATWQDPQGRRYLAMSMLGPVGKSAPPFKYSYGTANDGSIMAFEVRRDVASAKPVLSPLWVSREMHAPDVPVVANGVVYAFQSGKDSTETRAAGAPQGRGAGRGAARGADAGRGGDAGRGSGSGRAAAAPAAPVKLGTNAILYAFDAETGKQLFSAELDSFNHFNNPVVAGGTVYATTWDGKLYAFGLKK